MNSRGTGSGRCGNDTGWRVIAGVAFAVVGVGVAAYAHGLVKRPRLRRERDQRKAGNPTGKAPVRTPRPGDILLFFRPNRFRDHIIEWVTASKFYHASLYIGPDCMLESRPSGVVETDMQGREGEYVVLPAPHGKGEAALEWARTQIGAGYDMTDVIVIGLEHVFKEWHINYTKPGSYTCAELVVEAFRKVGVDLVPGMEPEDAAPSDIAKLLPTDQQAHPVGVS